MLSNEILSFNYNTVYASAYAMVNCDSEELKKKDPKQ